MAHYRRIALSALFIAALIIAGCAQEEAAAPVAAQLPQAAVAAAAAVPSFDWPPPRPSGFDLVPRSLLARPGPPRTLAEVDQRLVRALDSSGYVTRSYYSVPGGFALATQLERFGEDGRPAAGSARWAPNAPRPAFSLATYLEALFSSDPGRFRVIVFVITDRGFAPSADRPDRAAAEAWVAQGANRLPSAVGALPWTLEMDCTALIYEFAKPPGGAASLAIPGLLTADRHLRAAGLITALSE